MTNIRIATEDDLDLVWPVFREVVVAGDTYAYEQVTSKEAAFKIWFQTPRQAFVVEEGGEVPGTYYIKTNQAGPGSHVCNCGYMVSSKAKRLVFHLFKFFARILKFTIYSRLDYLKFHRSADAVTGDTDLSFESVAAGRCSSG